jgi:hypothetical protein
MIDLSIGNRSKSLYFDILTNVKIERIYIACYSISEGKVITISANIIARKAFVGLHELLNKLICYQICHCFIGII